MRTLVITALTAIALAGCINAHDSGDDSDDAGSTTAPASATGDLHSMNGPLHVAANASAGNLNTVNGSIHIGANAHAGNLNTVNGSIYADGNAAFQRGNTVNGSIVLDDHASAISLGTVNGAISLGAAAHVEHSVTSVNGALTLHSGSDVGGELSNVNGGILLAAVHVGGDISTVNGNIDVGANSRIDGGITVHKPTGWFSWTMSDPPRVVIYPGAVVKGPLRFEREVRLYVSDRATIGPVTGATPVKFSGDHPG
ncbi:MAG TPA: hypothetical protein VMB48_05535 [Steroidobacteraceae bacterium]|nr:hypothetical protein [Steroidobacteraceae bacterium]